MNDPDRPAPMRLHQLLQGFAGRHVLVLGDMVADEYIVGRPVGLSREAPLPVLEWVDRYIVPGGATNVARNVRSLGGEVAVAGVIGHDEPGQALRRRLVDEGIGVAGLVEEEGRPTSTKTRVIGGSQQVVSQQIARIDRVVRAEIGEGAKAHIIAYLQRELSRVDALIVSDYENGVINGDIIAAAVTLALAAGASLLEATHLSNLAAGIVVRRVGAATTTPAELATEIRRASADERHAPSG